MRPVVWLIGLAAMTSPSIVAGPVIALYGTRLLTPVMSRLGLEGRLAADNTAPKLLSLTATNNADDAGQNGGNPDIILAKFSEPMVLMLGDQDGKPIPRLASGSGYALLPNMVKYYVSSQGSNALPTPAFGRYLLPGEESCDDRCPLPAAAPGPRQGGPLGLGFVSGGAGHAAPACLPMGKPGGHCELFPRVHVS